MGVSVTVARISGGEIYRRSPDSGGGWALYLVEGCLLAKPRAVAGVILAGAWRAVAVTELGRSVQA